MYEPHYAVHDDIGSSRAKHFDDHHQSTNILAELDKIAPIKSFDAFPKVQSTYTTRSRRGGILTAVVGVIIFLLTLNDLGEYLYGEPSYEFHVDREITSDLQLNVDLTIAMPCHFLSIDLRDVVGDRLHLSDDFVKDGTTFEVGRATSMNPSQPTAPSAHKIIRDAHRSPRPGKSLSHTSTKRRTLSGISALFSRSPNPHSAYRPTRNLVQDGPACRIYGSVGVKKVTANLHITTLGHGYMSWEHTDHKLMNLSHIIHEFSFGPFFPAIAQPLDLTYETATEPFTIYQYFLSVVPTTYINARRNIIRTSQYAVTDYSRVVEHGRGVPGIFFKFDLEGLSMTVQERTTTLYQFLIRLVGVIGGVWTTAAFALRVLARAEREVKTKLNNEKDVIPSSRPSPSPIPTNTYTSYGTPPLSNTPGLYGAPSPSLSNPGTPGNMPLPSRGPNGLVNRSPSYFATPGQGPLPAVQQQEAKSR